MEIFCDFLLRQRPHHLGRRTQKQRTRRGIHFSGDHSAGAHQAIFSQHCAVQNNGTHADDTAISQSAAVDDCPVTDGTMFADTGLLMEYGVVLDIRTLTYGDGTAVATEHSAVPDIHIISQIDFPNHSGIGCTVYHKFPSKAAGGEFSPPVIITPVLRRQARHHPALPDGACRPALR